MKDKFTKQKTKISLMYAIYIEISGHNTLWLVMSGRHDVEM